MKANDSRRGREIAELARLLPVPAERDLPAGRKQTLEEHLMSELRQADSPADRRPARHHRPRRVTLAAAAGAGALAVAAAAVGLTSVTGRGSQPATAGHSHHVAVPGSAVPHSAVQLLARIAAAAARQPSPVVRDDQYAYIASKVAFSGTVVNADGTSKTTMAKPHERQIWTSVSDLCRPGLLREPAAGFDNEPLNGRGGNQACPDKGGLNDPTYRLLQSLPTSPRTLLNLIYAETKGSGTSPDEEAFTTIGDLLRESIAPPQVSAALYKAAALIPGVTVVPDAVDAAGRHGVAVAFADIYPTNGKGGPTADPSATGPQGPGAETGTREEWIFDKGTLQMIGERDISLPSGAVTGISAIQQRAFVGKLGQVPPAG